MKHYCMLAVCFLTLAATPAQGSLLSIAYQAVPCGDYAPGCSTMPTHVPNDLEFDRFAWTTFASGSLSADQVGVMTPTDTNSAGWVVGRIDLTLWTQTDIANFGPWDGNMTYHGVLGGSAFVYRADLGATCCLLDFPFEIYAVDDLGFIYTNGAYGPGLFHVSTADALTPNVVGPFPEAFTLALAYFGRDERGAFFVNNSDSLISGPQWALVPIPEPGTLVLLLAGLVVVSAVRRRQEVR